MVSFKDANKAVAVKCFGKLTESIVVALTADTPAFLVSDKLVCNSIEPCNATFTENSKFTVLKDCCIQFIGDANLEVSTFNTRVTMELVKNGDTILISNFLDLGVADDTMAIGANKIVDLEAGDYLQIRATASKNVNLTITGLFLSFSGIEV